MAEKKKSIIEESLLEFKTIEDALKANTKEILASTMKEEIEKVVRESLEEQEEIEDNDELEGLDDEMEELPAGEEAGEDLEDLDLDLDMGDAEADEMEDEEEESEELELPMGDMDGEEPEMELGDAEGMLSDLGDMEMDGEELEMDMDDELDLTMSSDEEVLKVFKKMGDEDEIEVVKDEEGISLKDNQTGAEYYIKESEELEEEELCEGCGSYDESEDMDEETIYEVELDEDMYEAYMESKEMEEGEHLEEDEMEEGEHLEEDKLRRHRKDGKQRYHGARLAAESRRTRKPRISESKRPSNVRKESYEKLLKEYKELKTKNGEYKEALKVFKTKINEVALFNQNLAHVTKLFTEHSTTKKEKMAILGRFDEIETIKESKTLYKNIAGELTEKSPITESVDRKVNKTIDSSKSNLNESTAYVDPQINKIKDLMSRIQR